MIKHVDKKIQNAIQMELFKAKESIKIAVAWFTNELLLQPLILKLQMGVSVELILNDDEINRSGETSLDFTEFLQAGGMLIWNDSKQLMHEKFCIIDDDVVIYGSYNWTNKAEYNEESIAISKAECGTTSFYLDRFNRLRVNYVKVEIPQIDTSKKAKIELMEGKKQESQEEIFITQCFANGFFPPEYQKTISNVFGHKGLSLYTKGLHFFDEIGFYEDFVIARDNDSFCFVDTNTFVPIDGLDGFSDLGIAEKSKNYNRIWAEKRSLFNDDGKWGLYDIDRKRFCIPPLFDSYRRLDNNGKYEVVRGEKKWYININKISLDNNNLDF